MATVEQEAERQRLVEEQARAEAQAQEAARLAAEEAARLERERAEAARKAEEAREQSERDSIEALVASYAKRQQELQTKRQAHAVRVERPKGDPMTRTIVVDPSVMGIHDDVWRYDVREDELVTYAECAVEVLEDEDKGGHPLCDDLRDYVDDSQRYRRFMGMQQELADACAEQLKDGVRGRWRETPTTCGGFFAKGFALAMEANQQGEGVTLKGFFLSVMDVAARQLDTVRMGIRETVKTALQGMGYGLWDGRETPQGHQAAPKATQTHKHQQTRQKPYGGFDPNAGAGRIMHQQTTRTRRGPGGRGLG